MKYKKSQMEIMGLAVVVILLVLGLLFVVKFVLFKSEDSYRGEYTVTQLAANTLNTVLNINTNCNGISVSELLQDASKDYGSIFCDNCNGNLDSRTCANFTVNYLLDKVLNKTLARDYYFVATVPGKNVVESGVSFGNRERERKTHFLQTDVGVMTIVLDIYGGEVYRDNRII